MSDEPGSQVGKIEKLKMPRELDGRDGPEPTRFNDWEKDGITYDF